MKVNYKGYWIENIKDTSPPPDEHIISDTRPEIRKRTKVWIKRLFSQDINQHMYGWVTVVIAEGKYKGDIRTIPESHVTIDDEYIHV